MCNCYKKSSKKNKREKIETEIFPVCSDESGANDKNAGFFSFRCAQHCPIIKSILSY